MTKASNSLYEAGILHNDLKPDNYVYSRVEWNNNNKFSLKLIDIGAACKVEEVNENYCSAFTEDYIDPDASYLRTHGDITKEIAVTSEIY